MQGYLSGSDPYRKNGELKSNEHFKGQFDTSVFLKGMFAVAWTFDMAKKMIDKYLN